MAEPTVRELIEKRLAACEAAERERHPVYEARMCFCCERSLGRGPRLPEDLRLPEDTPHPPNLTAANLSFAARVVLAVRDRFAGEAPTVYRAAKTTRQAYSLIVSDETHRVDKKTALRFAFALKCSPAEAALLLKSAGFAFSNADRRDCVLQACLEAKPPVWDLNEVNMLLQEYRVDFQF